MPRAIALLLTVLTGFSGLVYEVAWQKSFAILLGSHSEATAAVLGIFLGGLAVGYSLFGRVTRAVVGAARAEGREPRLLWLYGGVEAAIGAYALVFPFLFQGALAVSAWLPAGSEAVGFGVDVLMTALLIGLPTALMGGTIPILTQALARGLRDATRFHAFVYGFNTAGAFAGALAAGFWLVPALGIPATVRAMGAINLVAGGTFLLLGFAPRPVVAASEEGAGPLRAFAAYALVATLLGFAMMCVQTVLIRLGGLAFGASHFTFAMVVAVFVLCIALGSLVVAAFDRIPSWAPAVCALALGVLLAALYVVLPDAPYYAYLLRLQFSSEAAAFTPYWLATFGAILALLALPIGLSGATLPLLFHLLRNQVGDLGGTAGRLYSWNTVGSLLGALLGGYALLFWLDLHHVYRLAVVAVLAAAGILAWLVPSKSRLGLAAVGAATALALVLQPAWDPKRMNAGYFRLRTPEAATYLGPDAMLASRHYATLFHDDDPAVSVVVRQHGRPRPGAIPSRSIVNNGKPDGNLVGDYTTMALLGLLPCLFAPRCEDAFIIGLGTGVSAGELASLESMKREEVIEISPGVIAAAPLFDVGNLGVSRDPKIEIVRSDAYRALLRSSRDYDVIVSEPSNPWGVGVEMLFSQEFLDAAKQRLRPGGVFMQWFHLYETDRATLELVLRTYASVFDEISVWFAYSTDILMIGFKGPLPDQEAMFERLVRRTRRPDLRAGLARSGIHSLPALLAHEVLPRGVVHEARLEGEVHTLLHPVLSDTAARAFFRGRSAGIPFTAAPAAARVGASHSLLADLARRRGGELDAPALRVATEALCRGEQPGCATFLAYWARVEPSSPERDRLLHAYRRVPELARALRPEILERIGALWEEGGSGEDDVTPREALGASELFADYYHYAVPFPRAGLARVWDRCRGPGCREARARVEAKLGPLSATTTDRD